MDIAIIIIFVHIIIGALLAAGLAFRNSMTGKLKSNEDKKSKNRTRCQDHRITGPNHKSTRNYHGSDRVLDIRVSLSFRQPAFQNSNEQTHNMTCMHAFVIMR